MWKCHLIKILDFLQEELSHLLSLYILHAAKRINWSRLLHLWRELCFCANQGTSWYTDFKKKAPLSPLQNPKKSYCSSVHKCPNPVLLLPNSMKDWSLLGKCPRHKIHSKLLVTYFMPVTNLFSKQLLSIIDIPLWGFKVTLDDRKNHKFSASQ